jgi:hypothetical protein
MFFCAWNSCSSIESKHAIYKWRCPFFAWTSNITVVSVKIVIAKKTKQSNKICHLSASVMVWDHSTGQYSKKHVLFFSCEWNIMNLIYSIRLILNHLLYHKMIRIKLKFNWKCFVIFKTSKCDFFLNIFLALNHHQTWCFRKNMLFLRKIKCSED